MFSVLKRKAIFFKIQYNEKDPLRFKMLKYNGMKRAYFILGKSLLYSGKKATLF